MCKSREATSFASSSLVAAISFFATSSSGLGKLAGGCLLAALLMSPAAAEYRGMQNGMQGMGLQNGMTGLQNNGMHTPTVQAAPNPLAEKMKQGQTSATGGKPLPGGTAKPNDGLHSQTAVGTTQQNQKVTPTQPAAAAAAQTKQGQTKTTEFDHGQTRKPDLSNNGTHSQTAVGTKKPGPGEVVLTETTRDGKVVRKIIPGVPELKPGPGEVVLTETTRDGKVVRKIVPGVPELKPGPGEVVMTEVAADGTVVRKIVPANGKPEGAGLSSATPPVKAGADSAGKPKPEGAGQDVVVTEVTPDGKRVTRTINSDAKLKPGPGEVVLTETTRDGTVVRKIVPANGKPEGAGQASSQ
jgi:hypothetical protein